MARPDAGLLASLAESVADGVPIDWATAQRSATTPHERAIIQQLRVLADLAAVHRSLPASTAAPPLRHAPTRSNTTPAIGTWAHLALLERLGRGTFGEVYRAWDRHLEREVALKLLHGVRASGDDPSLSRDTSDSTDDPHVAAILREARLLARLGHTNVVHVYGVAVHEGRVGLWMELIRGETLEQWLGRNGPFNAREAALIGIDLCRALAAIHGAGLLHLDIKAQNVMRETGGRIVLMDFGTGRPSSHDAVADFAGTPLYLAPEIFMGSAANERTEVYSVGVLLYHLVTGAFPVSGSTLEDLQEHHAVGHHTRLRDARADLPTAFVSVVDRALAPDDSRYASAGALEAALVATLDSTASAAVPDAPAHLDRPLQPRRWRLGIAAAVLAVGVALAGLSWLALRDRLSPAGSAPGRTIAVLPLANLSNDPTQEYFADGMTDELIATLGHLDGVGVISRTSVMRYKRSGTPLPEIAKTLGVDLILEGSILTLPVGSDGTGDKRIRINARLIDASTDTQLWDRTFEAGGGDVFAVQSEVVRAVTDGIHARLGRAAAARSSRPQDFQVFDLYLRGRYYWNMRNEEGLTQSVRYFQAAIDRDSRYAPAHAGLADAYDMLGYYGFLGREEAISQARAAALRALDLDPSLGEAHASLGDIHTNLFEWDAAEASFRRAIELSPGYATAHHWYAVYLATQRRFDEASRHIQIASALDPLSASVSGAHGTILLWAGRFDDAISQLRAALGLDPEFASIRMNLAWALAAGGRHDLALAEAERAASLAKDDPQVLADLASILAVSGRRSDAAAMALDLAARYLRGEHNKPVAVAIVYATLGDNDRAFEWLDRALQRRDPSLGECKVEPGFVNLRKDPRFAELLRQAGLPP